MEQNDKIHVVEMKTSEGYYITFEQLSVMHRKSNLYYEDNVIFPYAHTANSLKNDGIISFGELKRIVNNGTR